MQFLIVLIYYILRHTLNDELTPHAPYIANESCLFWPNDPIAEKLSGGYLTPYYWASMTQHPPGKPRAALIGHGSARVAWIRTPGSNTRLMFL